MKHPTREEWMSYLYDELEAQPRRELDRHLAECPDCRAHLAGWRDTTQQLAAYKLAAPPVFRSAQPWFARPAVAALAAAVVLFAGVALGRVGGVSRAELAAVKRDVEAQALAVGRAEAQKQLQQFAADISKRLDTMQAQQVSDYTTLRNELETVAVLTEASFRQTASRIGELANSSVIPISNPTP